MNPMPHPRQPKSPLPVEIHLLKVGLAPAFLLERHRNRAQAAQVFKQNDLGLRAAEFARNRSYRLHANISVGYRMTLWSTESSNLESLQSKCQTG